MFVVCRSGAHGDAAPGLVRRTCVGAGELDRGPGQGRARAQHTVRVCAVLQLPSQVRARRAGCQPAQILAQMTSRGIVKHAPQFDITCTRRRCYGLQYGLQGG
eukprot:2645943-Pyramimonas_sp.AAC.1